MHSITPILGEVSIAQAIFLIGMALMIVVLLVRSRRHFRQVSEYQIPRPDAPPHGPSSAAVQSSASGARQPGQASMPPRDFERWEVAMHDLARDLSGQLDSKIRILELLIRDAEKASARLEAALLRAPGIAEAAREPPLAPMRNSGAAFSPGPADKARFDRIYALADAGLSPAKIANQIGSQIGEVELILGMRAKAEG